MIITFHVCFLCNIQNIRVKFLVYLWTSCKDSRCLMVGLPWGQLHGFSICAICLINFNISLLLSAVPIITAVRQALDANICLTRLGRNIWCSLSSTPPSLIRKINSSISSCPNCQWPLTGMPVSSARCPHSAKTHNIWSYNLRHDNWNLQSVFLTKLFSVI